MTIPLTDSLHIAKNAHILYLYDEQDAYLNNLLAYVRTGVAQKQPVLVIESSTVWAQVQARLNDTLIKDDEEYIHYVDNFTFYGCHGDFDIANILEHFGDILKPLLSKHANIRTWARVKWLVQEGIEDKLSHFEKKADIAVNEVGTISVCAYDGQEITSSLQTRIMRSHEYLMTDKELCRSTLYNNQNCRIC